jgi:hypothetical protein
LYIEGSDPKYPAAATRNAGGISRIDGEFEELVEPAEDVLSIKAVQ